ncbi:MAG TPA: hypothetical protein PK830_05595 [Candidatus Atribacteria bacterium]|nr:hypothetical protein [Candidatus Atribacteria bacterium]HPT78557.1 hypothetical protein [Candidatus Atribacteria bacterium]
MVQNEYKAGKKGGEDLSLDAVSDIRATEQEAEQIRKEAAEKARALVQQATAEAERLEASIIQKAKQDGEAALEAARLKAEEEISRLQGENDALSQEIVASAQGHMDEAVAFIKERIVKSYGNS